MRAKVLPGLFARLFLSIVSFPPVIAQPRNATLHKTFGEPGKIERGYSFVAAPDNKTYYVTGLKADSVFLL